MKKVSTSRQVLIIAIGIIIAVMISFNFTKADVVSVDVANELSQALPFYISGISNQISNHLNYVFN